MRRLLAVAVFALSVGASPAMAQEGVPRNEGSTTFVVDPAARVIRVSIEMTVTAIDEAWISSFFPVLAESENHRAVDSNGTQLRVTVKPSEYFAGGYLSAMVFYDAPLYVGEATTFRLDYEIPFLPARAPALSRGNDAVVAFPAIAVGSPGHARVEVRVPGEYLVDVGGGPLDEQETEGQVILRAEAIADPANFVARVLATRPGQLLRREVTAGGHPVRIEAWPDDPAWADFVAEQLEATVPVLEELVGLPWPEDPGGLAVVESLHPTAIGGYRGAYDRSAFAVRVGDDLDAGLLTHELAHIWFNGDLFEARWMFEGLAEQTAQSVFDALDAPGESPRVPDRSAPDAVALNDWGSGGGDGYAYDASWYVFDQIAEEVGQDGLRKVFAAADRGTDWRVLLDLLEDEAGSTKAAELFETYVVTEGQGRELENRAAARESYDELVEKGDGWRPPLVVRRAMRDWEFGEAGSAIAEAEEILDVRAQISQAAGVEPDLEEQYESATDLDELAEEASSTLAVAEDYQHARERYNDAGLLGRVGLVGSDAEARLDDARAALAGGDLEAAADLDASVERELDLAARGGGARVGLAMVLAAAAVAVRSVGRRRGIATIAIGEIPAAPRD